MPAIELPGDLDYPIVVIADLHGQRLELERLMKKLEKLPEWSDCALVFLGDFVDRGPNVLGTQMPWGHSRSAEPAMSKRMTRVDGWPTCRRSGGPVLDPYEKRSEALEAEVAWLDENWLTVPVAGPR